MVGFLEKLGFERQQEVKYCSHCVSLLLWFFHSNPSFSRLDAACFSFISNMCNINIWLVTLFCNFCQLTQLLLIQCYPALFGRMCVADVWQWHSCRQLIPWIAALIHYNLNDECSLSVSAWLVLWALLLGKGWPLDYSWWLFSRVWQSSWSVFHFASLWRRELT